MTDHGTSPAPAAWYPDPRGEAELRWHDGVGWTGHVHPQPPVPPPAGASASGVPSPSAPAALVRDAASWSLHPDAGNPPRDFPRRSRRGGTGPARGGPGWLRDIVELFRPGPPEQRIDQVRALAARGFLGVRVKAGVPVGSHAAMLPPGMSSPARPVFEVYGRPWGAAAGSHTELLEYEDSESDRITSVTTVVVPLPPDVAARYTGIAITPGALLSGPNVNTIVGIRGALQLQRMEFECGTARRSWRSWRYPNQDEVAAFELFTPPFIEQVSRWYSAGVFTVQPRVIVTSGFLVTWLDVDVVSPLHMPRFGHADHRNPNELDRLHAFTRDVHRRLVEEWQ